MHNIMTKENKEEAKTLEDKPRPADITKFSMFDSEREVLFAPLSSFKIDNLPQKVKHNQGFEYYEIKLEYIDTFVSSNETLFMNVTNAF